MLLDSGSTHDEEVMDEDRFRARGMREGRIVVVAPNR
jgi:hypothetical protein